MNLSELFLGSIGRIFASSGIMIVLLLMFIVSFRLYLSRKKKAYLSLTISLLLIIAQYIFIIAVEVRNEVPTISTEYFERVLQTISFILINMGIFQLYNRSKRKEFFYIYMFILTTFILSFLYFTGINRIENPTSQDYLFHSIWLDLYLFLLIFLCFYLVKPFIAQTIKYQSGLVIYFISHLSYVINFYIYSKDKPVLIILDQFLPILFYCMVFLFIFDRVVELLQAVYQSAITDGLTGLYNRRYFVNRISEHINRRNKISVIFCDIDNFKKLNDTQGHQKGDEILRQVAKIMMEESDDIGVAGRYGGEEMVIMLTDPTINTKDFAENLRKRIDSETIVTVSVGYSTYTEGSSSQELIKQSDHAMYHAKKTGKNRVSRFQGIQG
jgi:diguanylate cyclase (GGDEF)-like protein